MEATPDASASENRNRKFGLPNWMVNNIERLNFVTDFEQYACSPPETEGFLSEHSEHYDAHSSSPDGFCPVVEPSEYSENTVAFPAEIKSPVEIKHPQPTSPSSISHSPSQYHSILDTLKHEELFSSPDSTPCATPEPSPAPRRRMSGQQDTVRSNPGRWFYLGSYPNQDKSIKGQCLNVQRNKENKDKKVDKSDISMKREVSFPPKKDGLKLMISNFDINAVSPTSW
ncbi:uncharacterized protein LOC129219440 [Uloborus diversus]|uniref:uncharacterized protein LOC129219440 n=1 Tax=Uloborus diversus TaxID=327109 RepID=UPI0024098039|nr:uncharacterized protein LOC129219440 [Uloborus diversus]